MNFNPFQIAQSAWQKAHATYLATPSDATRDALAEAEKARNLAMRAQIPAPLDNHARLVQAHAEKLDARERLATVADRRPPLAPEETLARAASLGIAFKALVSEYAKAVFENSALDGRQVSDLILLEENPARRGEHGNRVSSDRDARVDAAIVAIIRAFRAGADTTGNSDLETSSLNRMLRALTQAQDANPLDADRARASKVATAGGTTGAKLAAAVDAARLALGPNHKLVAMLNELRASVG
jgi:hypothetical protein